MKLVGKVRNYLLDEEFNMRVLKSRVNVCNYDSIGYFDSDMVIINYMDGEVKIKGENLVVSKLLSNEVLINGDIKNIEMR